MSELPVIPFLDHKDPIVAAADRLANLTASANQYYGKTVIKVGDIFSRRWLQRTCNPYLAEIDQIANCVDGPGLYLLNMSFEWACTSATVSDLRTRTPRLLRTLDWPLDGLGRNLIIVRRETVAGIYDDVTWPGSVGVLTASAPGRFAAAINQPPMTRYTGIMQLDWLIGRIMWWNNTGLPPSHLLRRVFETCKTYDEARTMLCETPICMPVFYILVGIEENQGCIIERTLNEVSQTEHPACIANDWRLKKIKSYSRGWNSQEREIQMEKSAKIAEDNFSWMTPPILNPTTRVSVIANPAIGRLQALGWEKDGVATKEFSLNAV